METIIKSLRYQLLERNPITGEFNFVRPLGQSAYPRFHLYLTSQADKTINCSLHLDQKKPSYQGSTAHSGDYDSELVIEEAKRIEAFFNKSAQKNAKQQ